MTTTHIRGAKRDWTGHRTAHVTILKKLPPGRVVRIAVGIEAQPRPRWLARCDCGHEWPVDQQDINQHSPQSCKSCATPTISKPTISHLRSKHPSYVSWRGMIRRVNDPKHPNHCRYKHVSIDPRWLGPQGFDNFKADMGDKPPNMTLDRIKNELGYGPGNCRWATHAEQTLNKRPKGTATRS
jgi:hypothetical protein